jgi:hypothetical protein
MTSLIQQPLHHRAPAPYVFPKHFLTEREEYVQGIKLKTTGTSIIF